MTEWPRAEASAEFNLLHPSSSPVEADDAADLMGRDPMLAPAGHPALVCPITAAISSHCERAHAHSLRWAIEQGLVEPRERKFERLGEARFAYLAARCYPWVSADELDLAADWIMFLFFYDDMCDRQAATDPDYLEKLIIREDRLIAVAQSCGVEPGDTPLEHALADILARFAARASDLWLRRIGAHVRQYIEGVRWERILRAQSRVPSLATYSRLRLLVSAVFPCFDFSAIYIDPRRTDFVSNVYVQQLEVMANNYICWVNDIYGLFKEIAEGTTSNLVIVLSHERKLGWNLALDQAIEMCNAELKAFFELQEQLQLLGNPDCQAYVKALAAWMRGNLDWYAETRRYKHNGPTGLAACWSEWTSWSAD